MNTPDIRIQVNPVLKPLTLHTLKSLQDRLKCNALFCGKYGPLYTPKNYDNRDKSKAFRSIAYNEKVRQINALNDVISFVESIIRENENHS